MYRWIKSAWEAYHRIILQSFVSCAAWSPSLQHGESLVRAARQRGAANPPWVMGDLEHSPPSPAPAPAPAPNERPAPWRKSSSRGRPSPNGRTGARAAPPPPPPELAVLPSCCVRSGWANAGHGIGAGRTAGGRREGSGVRCGSGWMRQGERLDLWCGEQRLESLVKRALGDRRDKRVGRQTGQET
jgi:hypothetical protein